MHKNVDIECNGMYAIAAKKYFWYLLTFLLQCDIITLQLVSEPANKQTYSPVFNVNKACERIM